MGRSKDLQTGSSSVWLNTDETRTPQASSASPRHPGDFGSLFCEDDRLRVTGPPVLEYDQPHSRAGLHSAPVVSDWQGAWGQAHL